MSVWESRSRPARTVEFYQGTENYFDFFRNRACNDVIGRDRTRTPPTRCGIQVLSKLDDRTSEGRTRSTLEATITTYLVMAKSVPVTRHARMRILCPLTLHSGVAWTVDRMMVTSAGPRIRVVAAAIMLQQERPCLGCSPAGFFSGRNKQSLESSEASKRAGAASVFRYGLSRQPSSHAFCWSACPGGITIPMRAAAKPST